MGDHLIVDPSLPTSIGHLELLDIPVPRRLEVFA